MLKAGVRIYELGPSLSHDPRKLGNFGSSISRLHAKASVIDRRIILVGSMNLDARSARLNTEAALAIESPALAGTLIGLFREGLTTGAYRLRLSADGEHVEWLETTADGRQVVHTHEPSDGWWGRLKRWVEALFVGDELLWWDQARLTSLQRTAAAAGCGTSSPRRSSIPPPRWRPAARKDA